MAHQLQKDLLASLIELESFVQGITIIAGIFAVGISPSLEEFRGRQTTESIIVEHEDFQRRRPRQDFGVKFTPRSTIPEQSHQAAREVDASLTNP
ncbi:unnamed protein product [Calypogeia fissa]